MDERFVHLRDKNGKLKASVGYLKPDDEGKVKYAITIVSPSEANNDVTRFEARRKLKARLNSTPHVDNEMEHLPSNWRQYRDDVPHLHGGKSAYQYILNSKLTKIGTLLEKDLKSRIINIRQAIAELS